MVRWWRLVFAEKERKVVEYGLRAADGREVKHLAIHFVDWVWFFDFPLLRKVDLMNFAHHRVECSACVGGLCLRWEIYCLRSQLESFAGIWPCRLFN